MGKRRSDVFRMAKDATGIDPETVLNEAELEVLVLDGRHSEGHSRNQRAACPEGSSKTRIDKSSLSLSWFFDFASSMSRTASG